VQSGFLDGSLGGCIASSSCSQIAVNFKCPGCPCRECYPQNPFHPFLTLLPPSSPSVGYFGEGNGNGNRMRNQFNDAISAHRRPNVSQATAESLRRPLASWMWQDLLPLPVCPPLPVFPISRLQSL